MACDEAEANIFDQVISILDSRLMHVTVSMAVTINYWIPY